MNNRIPDPFFIAALPRSGANLLLTLLNSTYRIGHLAEYLYQMPAINNGLELLSYFNRIYKQAKSSGEYTDLWGTKVGIENIPAVEKWIEESGRNQQSIKWVWLQRRDKMRQAVSFINANTNEIWQLYKNDSTVIKKKNEERVNYDLPELYLRTTQFLMADMAWCNFFKHHEITPYKLYYEDFIDNSTWDLTIANIFDFLGVSYDLPLNVSTELIRQSGNYISENQKQAIEHLREFGIPLKYLGLDLEGYDELELDL